MLLKMLDLYKSILSVGNMYADKDGFVDGVIGEDRVPVTIDGKRLMLPTDEVLRIQDKSNIVVCHPLYEHAFHGETPVVEKLRKTFTMTINMRFNLMMTTLLKLAITSADHKRLSPDQQEFLSATKNADEETYKVFSRLLKAMPLSQSAKQSIGLYLKKSGTVNGKKVARLGVVFFPLYTELKAATKECYGVKLRPKDRETILKLMDYLIPSIATPDFYNRGSSSEVAPYMDALMKAVMAIAGPINDQVELFRSFIGDAEADELAFNGDWVETMDTLDQNDALKLEIRKTPMQAGNEGLNDKVAATATASPAPTPTPAPGVAPPPGTTFATQAPAPLPPPVWMQPPAPVQYPGWQPQAPAPIVHTGRGLDFASLMQSNPAMYAAAMAGQQNPAMFQQQRQPRWTQPDVVQTGQYPGVVFNNQYGQQAYGQPGYFPPSGGSII